jgi:3D (Asp-Asp-Asp) domain-containing protein
MKKFGVAVCLMVILLAGLTEVQASARFEAMKNQRPSRLADARGGLTKKGKSFVVTLTTYWAVGKGSDYWTRKFTSSTGQRLVSGVSVAADPRVIPYGSIIEIKGIGRRVVKDTGSHVVKRLASQKRGVNYPVIDLFFERREDALSFARKHPAFAEVRVIRQGS